jgi:hypothetical protein
LIDALALFGVFVGAYLGVRVADSPRGVLAELHDLALLPLFLCDLIRHGPVTDADVQRALEELEATLRERAL